MKQPGRPPKLDDRQKAEIGRRLAMGEKASDLRKEYRLSETTFRRNFSADYARIHDVGMALAQAESALSELPISAQVSARSLADRLKGLTDSLVTTATIQGKTAAIMARHGLTAAQGIQPGSGVEELRTVAACTELANKAGAMGLGLLTAGKNFKPDDGNAPGAPIALNILPVKTRE